MQELERKYTWYASFTLTSVFFNIPEDKLMLPEADQKR